MQGIDVTFDELSLDREQDAPNALPQIVLGAAVALAGIGCVAAYVMLNRLPDAPTPGKGKPAAQVASYSFGEMIIEPGWGPKAASPNRDLFPLPALEAIPPTASASTSPPGASESISRLESVPPANLASAPTEPPAAINQPDNVPLPPERDVAAVDDSVPLPPARPPEFQEPAARQATPDRRLAQPDDRAAPAPGDNRNILQRLLGLGRPSGPSVASAPASSSAPISSPRAVVSSERTGGRGLFAFFSSAPNFDRLGYDRTTAVYDISARTVYLPDGTRLEAHSGLGDALDNPRYVSERMRGPTPPHLYELEPREASFHGVQALRLNPVGDGGLYGRAGLLAHPYMLGPNGDSNGCVSFKNYEAFLRAYQNGQIKRLAVVARL